MVKELCWEVMFNFGIFEKGGGSLLCFYQQFFSIGSGLVAVINSENFQIV